MTRASTAPIRLEAIPDGFILVRKDTHDKLIEACRSAKRLLIQEMEEPGRTVFWELVSALDEVAKNAKVSS